MIRDDRYWRCLDLCFDGFRASLFDHWSNIVKFPIQVDFYNQHNENMFAFIWPRSSKKLLVKRTTFNLILFRRPNLIWCEFSSVNAKSPPPRSVVADVCLNYVSSFKVIHNFWFQCYTHSSPHSQTTDRLTVGEYSIHLSSVSTTWNKKLCVNLYCRLIQNFIRGLF